MLRGYHIAIYVYQTNTLNTLNLCSVVSIISQFIKDTLCVWFIIYIFTTFNFRFFSAINWSEKINNFHFGVSNFVKQHLNINFFCSVIDNKWQSFEITQTVFFFFPIIYHKKVCFSSMIWYYFLSFSLFTFSKKLLMYLSNFH